jgi:hypothetical protein
MHIRSSALALFFLFTAACQNGNGGKSGSGPDGGGTGGAMSGTGGSGGGSSGGAGGGSTGGVSGDTGWTRLHESISVAAGNSITVDGNYIIVGTSKGVLVSADDGATWAQHTAGLPDSPVVALVALDDRVLAGMIGAPVVFVSTDHGSTWTQSDTGLPQSTDAYAFGRTSSAVLVGMSYGASDPGAEGGLFRSSDKGATWTKSSAGLPQTASATAFATIGSTLFSSAGAELATSTDDGNSWQTQKLTTGNSLGLVALGGALFASTSSGPSLDSAVRKSADLGVTWTDSGTGLPVKDPANVLFGNGTHLYATAFAQSDNGVYRSTDSGASWHAFNENLEILGTGIAPRIVAMAAHGKYLFAVESSGNVWRRDL